MFTSHFDEESQSAPGDPKLSSAPCLIEKSSTDFSFSNFFFSENREISKNIYRLQISMRSPTALLVIPKYLLGHDLSICHRQIFHSRISSFCNNCPLKVQRRDFWPIITKIWQACRTRSVLQLSLSSHTVRLQPTNYKFKTVRSKSGRPSFHSRQSWFCNNCPLKGQRRDFWQ